MDYNRKVWVVMSEDKTCILCGESTNKYLCHVEEHIQMKPKIYTKKHMAEKGATGENIWCSDFVRHLEYPEIKLIPVECEMTLSPMPHQK